MSHGPNGFHDLPERKTVVIIYLEIGYVTHPSDSLPTPPSDGNHYSPLDTMMCEDSRSLVVLPKVCIESACVPAIAEPHVHADRGGGGPCFSQRSGACPGFLG